MRVQVSGKRKTALRLEAWKYSSARVSRSSRYTWKHLFTRLLLVTRGNQPRRISSVKFQHASEQGFQKNEKDIFYREKKSL